MDAAHANPNDPHEVFFPDFNNFELTIFGTFDTAKCYEVSIKRKGGSDCGSANSSGGDVAVVTADTLVTEISPNSQADYKRADDWAIEVRERAAGCVGDSFVKVHPIPLRIAGCTSACLLNGVEMTATPSTVSCGGQSRLCAEVPTSSGNLVYDWDTDGDGGFDDLTTAAPENCIDVNFTATTQVGVRVTDLGTFEPDCTTAASTLVSVDGQTCDDDNICTDDTCDPEAGCIYTPVTGRACDDSDACTQIDTCLSGVCTGSNPVVCTPLDQCHDAGTCDPSTGVCSDPPKPDDTVCDDGDACTINDICSDGECAGTLDPVDTDGDGAPDVCDKCAGRDDFRSGPEGTCPEAIFHLAVLEEPSDLSCSDGRPDCSETDPPASCEEVLGCGSNFVVEIWVSKFSPDVDPNPPHDPGISCAYVDLVSHIPVGEIGIEYGAAFNAGPAFEHGTFVGDGGVTDLGACNFGPGGVGVWPEWVLVARVELQQDHGEDMWFELTDPTSAEEQLATSVYGQGFADPVAYGDDCESTIWCRGHEYDACDEDCNIGPGDLSCCAACWLLCPDDSEYPFACCGQSCDNCNFVKCSEYDCFGPEDFSYFHTAWLKWCDDETIILSDMDDDGVDDACDIGRRSIDGLPPLATDELLRSFGLEVPSKDWKGYERGILREWQRLETRHRPAKQPLSERERPRKQRGR